MNAIGYYGKMKESEKSETYLRSKNGDVPVIVATRAQELERAGRDGKSSEAHIFYCDEDIHHVGFWSGDLAR